MKILLTVNNNSFTTIHSLLFLIIPFLCAFYSVHSHKRITTDTISNIFIIQFFQHRRCIYIFIHTYIHAYIYIKSKRKDESYSTLNTWNKMFGIYLHLNKRSIRSILCLRNLFNSCPPCAQSRNFSRSWSPFSRQLSLM